MGESGAAKAVWRSRVLAARARRTDAERAALATVIQDTLIDLVTRGRVGLVAAYAAMPDEPQTRPALDALRALGVELLLPVVAGTPQLDWAAYDGDLVPGRWGLLEPPGTRLGPAALSAAGLIVVPAIAIDRRGRRLGRGGGYYDRALAALENPRPTVAAVWPEEIVDELPAEPHDQHVDGVITLGGVEWLRKQPLIGNN